MKKALALVLALVLALSLGVSAFALTFVKLDKEPSSSASKTPIVVGLDYDAEEEIFLARIIRPDIFYTLINITLILYLLQIL